MVRPSFIKSLNIDSDNKMTVKDWLIEIFWYNQPIVFLRHIGRFLKRLPKWLKLCWKTENWDYEGLYDFIDMQLKEMKKAQMEDTWHVQSEVKRRIKQINLVLLHLDKYRNWQDYYEWPAHRTQELENGNFSIIYDDPKAEEMIEHVYKMEQKHYDKFWNLLKQRHTGWWT